MIAVIDSNILYGDPRLAKSEARILLEHHRRGSYELAIPEVVVRELAKNFAKVLDERSNVIAAAAAKLSELGHDPSPAVVRDIGAARDEYLVWLRAHLHGSNVRVPPVPAVDLGELVDRAVAERRPFQAQSKGFRDAMIWETVRALAHEDCVVVISNNPKDFAESTSQPTTLHPHLVADLDADGHGPDRVELIASLADFIKQYVPTAAQLQAVQRRLASEAAFDAELEEQARAALAEFALGVGDDVTVVDSRHAHIDNVELLNVDGIDSIRIVDAYDIGEPVVISLEIRVRAWLTFSFTADRASAEWLTEEKADVQIDLWEETWVQGSTMSCPVEVSYAADYEPESGELGEFEQVSAVDCPALRDRRAAG